ncbi:MAG: 50S ribosomal protein L3 [Phycisphaerae bacterium]
MIPALIGTKIGMTRLRDDKGMVTPVTVVQAGPCTVLQIRTQERDGYHAVQMGFMDAKPHRSSRPLIGHAANAGTGPKRYAREIRLADVPDVGLGDVLTVSMFEEAKVAYVDVVGTSKGRGFSGVMRRHGFGGLEASHGVERKHRSGGSIGGHANIGLGRGVKKGKKMPGQWGNKRITQRNMKLKGIDRDHNLLLIEGSIPGPAGGVVCVRKSKTAS